jgi:hypothetical protein
MVYNQVVYILQPGKLNTYLEIIKEMTPLAEKAGYKLVGSWRTTIGNMSQVTSMWAIEGLSELEKAGTRMVEDKEYVALAQKMSSIITSYTTTIMRPTPNSPLK